MIDPAHPQLSIARQRRLVAISRSAFYGPAKGESPLNEALMRLIDEQFLETPCYGSRQRARHLRRQGHEVGRERIRRLMAKIGVQAVRPASEDVPAASRTPHLAISAAEHGHRPPDTCVWCADITYLPMRRGFLYLMAVMDWATRKVLAWGVSNTLHADFCIEALEEALTRHGPPEIFNTDQGGQFTSPRSTGALRDAGARISMDGRGRWMDNVFIERLWRTLKYECIHLHAFETGSELRAGLQRWIEHCNAHRPHSALGGRTPDEAHQAPVGYQAAA